MSRVMNPIYYAYLRKEHKFPVIKVSSFQFDFAIEVISNLFKKIVLSNMRISLPKRQTLLRSQIQVISFLNFTTTINGKACFALARHCSMKNYWIRWVSAFTRTAKKAQSMRDGGI